MSIDEAKSKNLKQPKNQAANTSKSKKPRYRSPQRRIVVGLIQFSLIAYATILLVLIGMETRLVYPGAFMNEPQPATAFHASIVPSPPVDVPVVNSSAEQNAEQNAEPRIETVRYESTDGVTLRGRLLERGPDKEIVLYFHGNGTKAAWLDSWIQELSEQLDATVMAAEYRGFEDDTDPTEKGVLADSLAARDFLCDRYQTKPKDIILYGESLGGGCAVAVASSGGAKALILDRTFDRMIDVAAGVYPFLPVRWVMRNRYDSVAKLTVYHGPLISIHGTDDELIPIEHGRRLYDSARCERKHWIEVDGLGHIGPLPPETMKELTQTLQSFIASDR